MKVLQWSQRFSHHKYIGIVPNAKWQLTHKSFVGYCLISNPSKILWLSSLPARIMKIKSKMKTVEWSQYYSLIFRRSRAANSEVSDGIWPKFKPIQAFIADLVTCKNKEDPLENEGTRVVTTFLPLSVYVFFPNAQGQLTHKSFIGICPISNPSKILWLSSLPARIKKNQSKLRS